MTLVGLAAERRSLQLDIGSGDFAVAVETIRQSGLFDARYYAGQRYGLPVELDEAIAHYIETGCGEGLDPGPGFSTRFYLGVNDDVVDAGCNPLLHYIQYGKAEGRAAVPRHIPSRINSVPPPVAPAEAEWDRINMRQAAEAPAVDVMVPVYRGYDETLRCLFSVLSTPQKTPFRLVVVNDCSPEPRLEDALARLAGRGLIELHRTERNLGFVSACNLGMALHPERDIVLLNSDTEPHGDWLDRLRAAATREPTIATATPLSNNAEICSYPLFCRDNWAALEVDDAELDRLASLVNKGRSVEIPTGVGFCMYVRRACLHQIGGFDEENFGQGYGEENDFCRRAIRAGWRNVLAVDVFVRHYGGASFGASKFERTRAAMQTLQRLHGDYAEIIAAFIRADPVRPFREALDAARLSRRAARGAVLFVTSTLDGGTQRHTNELASALEADGAPVFFCQEIKGRPGWIHIQDPHTPDTVNLPAFELLHDVQPFADVLRRIGIRHMHVHQLAGMDSLAPDFFRAAARAADLAYDATLHDYLSICPRINLIDRSGCYCGEPQTSVCEDCVKNDGSPFGAPSVWQWRDRWAAFLHGARRIFVPDPDVALRIGRHVPGLTFTVRPHAHNASTRWTGARTPAHKGGVRRIALLGAIGPHKGSGLLAETARAAKAQRLPMEFVVVGYTDRDDELNAIGNVSITGPYQEADAVAKLLEANAALVWLPAVWPETFSYTLSTAIEA
jgi:GT2 family glycosyltransferase/glycosyltransferase involved in cell wall biosynthesis